MIGTAKYNDTIIETQVTALAQGAISVLEVSWDPTGATSGNYTIKAEATIVTDEPSTDNKSLADGTVKIIASIMGT